MSKPKRKHHSSSSKDTKKTIDKNSVEKPSKCKQRIQEAQAVLQATVCQLEDHLKGEFEKRSKEQDAKIEALQKQLASQQAKIKNLLKAEKLNCKTIRELEAKIHRLNVEQDEILTGRYDQCETPEGLPNSSFVAVTPSTSCNTLRGESGRGLVLQMPGIRAFTSKNEETSEPVFIVDVDRCVSASDLFEPPGQHEAGRNFDEGTGPGLMQENSGRNSHGSVERIHSWMKDARDHFVDRQLEDQIAGEGLSQLEQGLEEEQDPLADSDFPQSFSDNEADQRQPSPVRRPLKTANHVKNKSAAESVAPRRRTNITTSSQPKLRPPQGQNSVTIEGKRIWTGKKKCHVCRRTSTRIFCASRKCGLPVCGKDSEKRNYCKNYNPVMGACCRENDGNQTLIRQADDVCSQTIGGKRVFAKKSNKKKLAPEQGRCEDCKLMHDRNHQKTCRTRCDCCYNFYCRPHRKEPVVECLKHRGELPHFTTDTEVQSSIFEGYDSDTSSNHHPTPLERRTIATTSTSPKRRISTSSASSNNSTPRKKLKVTDSKASGNPHSVALPKILQDYSYMATRCNIEYGL